MTFRIYNSLVAFAKAHREEPLKVLKTLLAWEATSYNVYGVASADEPWNSDANITFGSCGWRDILLRDVLEKAGIESRRISLFNVPIQFGHVGTEVKIGNDWVFVDATTGLIFQDRRGDYLSLTEVRELWPKGAAIPKVSKLPPMTGVPADIKAIDPDRAFSTLTDTFIRHPGYPGRDDVVIVEAFSTYNAFRVTAYQKGKGTPVASGQNEITLKYDAKNSEPWELVQNNYDSRGRLDYTTVRYDNETGQSYINDFKFIDYDQSGLAGWSSKTTYLDETYFVRFREVKYRDGTKTIETYDHASDNWLRDSDWITHTFAHYTRGTADHVLTIHKSGDLSFQEIDAIGSRAYVTAVASYSASQDAWSATITMDDGSVHTANVVRGGDVHVGSPSTDFMVGERGNDTYYVDPLDVVLEQRGQGIDTVVSASNYVLTANVENLVLTGDATYGTGNELGNVITGNDAGNVLAGLAGRDALFGGAGPDLLSGGHEADVLQGDGGADLLVGGRGGDRFVFRTGDLGGTSAAADFIRDFNPVEGDHIDLRGFDANSTRPGRQSFHLVEGAFDAAGQIRAVTVGNETRVLLNTDADSTPEAVIRVLGVRPVHEGWFIF